MDPDPENNPPYRLIRPWEHIPELQQFSPKMRFQIWEYVNSANRFGCLATALLFVWMYFLLGLYPFVFAAFPKVSEFFENYNGYMVLGTVLTAPMVLIPMQRRLGRRKVRAWLVNTKLYKRAPACLACGYSLIGTPAESTSCPECGKPIPEGETPHDIPH